MTELIVKYVTLVLGSIIILKQNSAADETCNRNAVTEILKKNSTADDVQNIHVVTFIQSLDNFTTDQVSLLSFLQMKLHRLKFSNIDYSLVYMKSENDQVKAIQKLTEVSNGNMRIIYDVSKTEREELGKYDEHHIVILDSFDEVVFNLCKQFLRLWSRAQEDCSGVYFINIRCGRVTYEILPPWSFVQYPYVKAAILSTYYDDPCGNCTIQSKNDTSENTGKNLTEPIWPWSESEQLEMNSTTLAPEDKLNIETESSPIQVNIMSSKEMTLENNKFVVEMKTEKNETVAKPREESTTVKNEGVTNTLVTDKNEEQNTTEISEETVNKDADDTFKHYSKFFPWIAYEI